MRNTSQRVYLVCPVVELGSLRGIGDADSCASVRRQRWRQLGLQRKKPRTNQAAMAWLRPILTPPWRLEQVLPGWSATAPWPNLRTSCDLPPHRTAARCVRAGAKGLPGENQDSSIPPVQVPRRAIGEPAEEFLSSLIVIEALMVAENTKAKVIHLRSGDPPFLVFQFTE